jgi:hypothetical protein
MPTWLTVAITVGVPSIVALSVAHMHRKQMRQVELHRFDPAVPLIPPNSKFTEFLILHGATIASFCYTALRLCQNIFDASPLTGERVGYIAAGISTLYFLIMLEFVQFWAGRLAEADARAVTVISSIVTVMQRQLGYDRESYGGGTKPDRALEDHHRCDQEEIIGGVGGIRTLE